MTEKILCGATISVALFAALQSYVAESIEHAEPGPIKIAAAGEAVEPRAALMTAQAAPINDEVSPAISRPVPGDMEKLFTYFEEIQKLTSGERLQEYELLKRTYAQDRSEFARLQLAMLLSVSDSTFYDEARAQSLIDPTLKEKSPRSRLRPIAYLLNIMLSEQRSSAEALRGLNDALQEAREHNQALEQKLEALKTLERNLIERESGKSPRSQ